MTIAEQLLAQDFSRYQRMLHTLQTKFEQLPKGTLTYRTLRGRTDCHLQFRDSTGIHNQPVSQDQIEQLQQSIQQRKELRAEIQSLQQILKKLEKTFPQLPSLSATFQSQDSPQTDSAIPYSKKPYRTAKGDYVRSKSELIIANGLYANQITYTYEKPLTIEGCRYDFYPDFTIETPHQKQVVYWEHAGLMTAPAYRDKWEWKRKVYEKNGICEWNKNLIITYESEAGDLSPDIIEKIIAGLLLR